MNSLYKKKDKPYIWPHILKIQNIPYPMCMFPCQNKAFVTDVYESFNAHTFRMFPIWLYKTLQNCFRSHVSIFMNMEHLKVSLYHNSLNIGAMCFPYAICFVLILAIFHLYQLINSPRAFTLYFWRILLQCLDDNMEIWKKTY